MQLSSSTAVARHVDWPLFLADLISGHHSNIPPCCVLEFAWRSAQGHDLQGREFRQRYGDRTAPHDYVACSRCMATGRVAPMHYCDRAPASPDDNECSFVFDLWCWLYQAA